MANDSGPKPLFLRETRSLAMAAILVAIGFFGSRLLGLARSIIIADSFGTEADLDAYWVAFRLPDLVFQLVAGATLASAFIPVFAGERSSKGANAGWQLASSVLNLVLIGTFLFAVTAFLLAPQVLPLLAPGLGEDSGQQEELRALAVKLTRIMLISPILFAVSGMFMGILNARRRFLTPGLAPMLYNLAIIVAALLFNDVRALAYGVVSGASLHLLVQIPDLRAARMHYNWTANWRDAAVRRVGALMAPRVLGLAATQISFYFVAIFFASRLGEGAISAVNFAWLIVMTPLGVVGMAISTAAFPTLAEQAASGSQEVATTLARSLRFILFLSLPIGMVLALLAHPIVTVLLQRGAFEADSAKLTAQALTFYGFALFAHGGIEILSRGFYALGDTRTPVTLAVGSMILTVGLSIILTDWWDIRGLALALSSAAIVEFLLMFHLLGKRLTGLLNSDLLASIAKMLTATAISAGAGWLLLEAFSQVKVEDWWDSLSVLAVGGLFGAVAYLGMALLLRCEEVGFLLERVRPRR